MHSLGRVMVDDAGQVVRMSGASQDITARKAAEEIVGRSERRLQTIIDAQPACVKLVSFDGLLLDMNPAGLDNGLVLATCHNSRDGRSSIPCIRTTGAGISRCTAPPAGVPRAGWSFG